MKTQPESRGLTRVVDFCRFFVPNRLLLSLSESSNTRVQQTVKPLLAKVNNHKDLSKLSVKDSQKPETPKETALRRLNEKIELMRQEFEELQFLKQIAETLKSLRTRLINERWD